MVTLLEERVLLSTATLISLDVSSALLNYGQNEVFTATVTTNPPSGTTPTGGVVTFKDGAATLGTGNLVNGTATFSTVHLPAGANIINASYGGTAAFAASTTSSGPPVISTLAGGGGAANRQALYFGLGYPNAVALDSAGNLFIADGSNEQVLMVSAATGAVTVVAGDGNPGHIGDGGQATAAELSGPSGLALDGSNNLFISETGSNVVREVNLTTGIISTYAGTGAQGYSGDTGGATAAKLNYPNSIALDSSGNLYIADTYNEVIREVNATTHVITTVAGKYTSAYLGGYDGDGGQATAAKLNAPMGVGVDSSGNIFIADSRNNLIREVDATTKIISTVAGTDPTGAGSSSSSSFQSGGYAGDGGPATAAKLNSPQGMFITASGDLYFADTFNSAIREVSGSTQKISTVAGSGKYGNGGAGGLATNAKLSDPSGIVLDAAGDILIADTYNGVVREVSNATGLISTIVGGDAFGYSGDGGPASSSELASPGSVAVDGSNNVYVADTNNNVVREINALTGKITTVAGGGEPVYLPINDYADPVFDAAGNLFVADRGNDEVYEIDHATGEISVIAGNGTGGYSGDGGQARNAELHGPSGLAVLGSSTLFIADTYNSVIRAVDLNTGVITTYAGVASTVFGGGYGGDGGLATAAMLNQPSALALDGAGNLFIADSHNNVIREVDAGTLKISTVAGNHTSGYSGDGGLATDAELSGPQGLAFDTSGNMFIADSGNNIIREVDATTKLISTIGGTDPGHTGAHSSSSTLTNAGYSGDGGLATAAKLRSPTGIFVTASGDLYFADTFNNAIREISASSGNISTVAGVYEGAYVGGYAGDGGPATAAQLSFPRGLAVDGAGDLFIADTSNSVIRKVDAATQNISTFAGAEGGLVYSNNDGPATDATLANPDGIVVDSQGNIFIADEFFNAIREVNGLTGQMTTIAGNGTYGYSGDGGQATNAELADPAGLALDGHGNLFIADSGNNVIRELNLTTGIITTVAGNGTYGGSGDGGLATLAELSTPTGVAVDSAGNIYIADQYDNEIREVDAATKHINTIAGNGTYGSSGDGGQATDAQLADPGGVALDGSGKLFIADTDNELIRVLDLSSGVITTFAGTPGVNAYGGDGGAPTDAQLDSPAGIAVDASGNIFIADTFNNTIREVSSSSGGKLVTVAKAALTITANSTSKTYGGSLTFAGTEFTKSALVSGDSITSVTLASGGTPSRRRWGAIPSHPAPRLARD